MEGQMSIFDYESKPKLDYSCFETFAVETPQGTSIRYGQCCYGTSQPKDCSDCDVFKSYYNAIEEERNKGAGIMESHKIVCERFGIRVAEYKRGDKNDT